MAKRAPTRSDHLRSAVAQGIVVVTAAGNFGDSGWTGPWTDADANDWLEFAPGDENDDVQNMYSNDNLPEELMG